MIENTDEVQGLKNIIRSQDDRILLLNKEIDLLREDLVRARELMTLAQASQERALVVSERFASLLLQGMAPDTASGPDTALQGDSEQARFIGE